MIQTFQFTCTSQSELPIKYVQELLETVVRTYRDRVADHIFLTVPKCGQPWKIQLRKSPRHERMWLEKGWEEFANFYKLDQGDFATFSYEGKHSHFQVRIYSSTDLEIDYPIRGGGIYGNVCCVSSCLERFWDFFGDVSWT